MKSMLIAVALSLGLVACSPSPQPKQPVSAEDRENIKRETLDQLKRAENEAFRDGVRFGKMALLTKRSQCSTDVSEAFRLQSTISRGFREETKSPFVNGCIEAAKYNVRVQRLELEAKAAAKAKALAKAAASTKIATVAKNKRPGPKGDPRLK